MIWRVLILIFLSLSVVLADATEVFYPNRWNLQVQGVEVLFRNDKVGIKQVAKVKFSKWLEIPVFDKHGVWTDIAQGTDPKLNPRVTLGLTKSGLLYQVVEYGDRNIMRVLNGGRVLSDFLVTKNGHLLGVDRESGEVLLFRGSLWSQSPVKSILHSAVGTWVAGSVVIAAVIGGVNQLWPGGTFLLDDLKTLGAFGAVGLAGTSFFVHLIKYDLLNMSPNGFEATGLTVSEDREKEWGASVLSQLKDYIKVSVLEEWKAPPRCILDAALPEGTYMDVDIE